MIKDLISIILPTYNRFEYLKKAINSILIQSYQNFEILVIDDCSSDKTEKSINSFSDKRIRYLKNRINLGHSKSRNIGIRNALGEYIAFIDDDIEWFPEKLSIQIEILKNSHNDVGGVFTSYYKIWDKKRRLLPENGGVIPGLTFFDSLLYENFIDTPALLIKKQCIEKCGVFDENMKCFVDWDLSIRIAKEFKLEFIKKPQYLSNDLPGSVTRQSSRIRAHNLEYVLNKFYKDISKNKKIESIHTARIGLLYVLAGDVVKARQFLIKSIKSSFNLKTLLIYYSTFSGNSFIQLIIKIKRFFIK